MADADLSRIKRNVKKMVDMGAPEADIDQYIGSEGVTLDQVRAASTDDRGIMGSVNDFATSANNMLLFGWGPKYTAGMQTILPEFLGGTGRSFEENLGAANSNLDRIKTERPYLNAAAETVGLGAQMLSGAGAAQALGAVPALTGAGRVGQAAGFGAVQGGLTGAGEAKLGDEGFGGLTGMAIGGAAGAAGGALVEGIGKLISSRGMTAADKASKRVAQAMLDDGVNPGGASDALRRARDAGASDFALIDAGKDNVRRLGRTVRNLGGEGAEQLADFAESRAAGQADRYSRAVSDTVGPNQPIDDLRASVMQTAREKTGPVYSTLTDAVELPKDMKEMLARAPSAREAFQKAQKLAAENGVPIEPIFVKGQFNPKIEQVSAKTLHYLRQGFDEVIDSHKTVLPSGREEISKIGAAVSKNRKALDEFLKTASPQIREADSTYSAYAKYASALDAGRKYQTLEPAQLQALLKKMDPAERAMYRLSSAWQLHKKIGDINDSQDLTRRLMASPNERKRITAIMGGGKDLQRLLDFVDSEKSMSRSNRALMGNSTTAQQAEDIASFRSERLADTVRSGPVQAFKDFMAETLTKAVGVSDAEKRAIADILTNVDDAELARILGGVSKQAQDIQQSAGGQLGADIVGAATASEAARERIMPQQRRPLELTIRPGQ